MSSAWPPPQEGRGPAGALVPLPGAADASLLDPEPEEPEPEPEPELEPESELSLAAPRDSFSGREPERARALELARRSLPAAARTWSIADVRAYFAALGLPAVADTLSREEVNGEHLLVLARDDELIDVVGEELSLGKKFAVTKAVAAIGAGSRRSLASGTGGAGGAGGSSRTPTTEAGAAPVAVGFAAKLISRSMARSRTLSSKRAAAYATGRALNPVMARPSRSGAEARERDGGGQEGLTPAPFAQPQSGNLSEAQVKGRSNNAKGWGAAFVAVEALILLTGSSSIWLHCLSVLPGLFCLLFGVTAAFSTWFMTAATGGGRVLTNPDTGQEEVHGGWQAQQGAGATKLAEEHPEDFLDMKSLGLGKRSDGQPMSDEELAALPDVEWPKLQRKLIRRGQLIYLLIVLLVCAVLGPAFCAIGFLARSMKGDENMCGVIGQLKCDTLSVAWEFGCGVAAIGCVLLYLGFHLVLVFCVLPASAKKRREARAAVAARRQGDALAHSGDDDQPDEDAIAEP